jgi:threonine dehydrogenase-like Zn-dependent dehydrogenase
VKSLILELQTGSVTVAEAPMPATSENDVLVESRCSLISAGTEGSLVDFGRAGLLSKIRKQRDRIGQIIDKSRADGIVATYEAVTSKLQDPMPLGYCVAGIVRHTGSRTAGLRPGDRVVTNGPHAEVVCVPNNLAVRVPDEVDFESAAFTPLASIALQGLRLADPTLGETIVVYGLGLIGQLAVQLVRAHGCRAIGIDTDPDRVALAERFGAEGLLADTRNVVESVQVLTSGIGADAVLLTLATDSDEPMHLAARMSRKRGRIVLVGVTGLYLRREDFYEKELSLQVSCSYGPGRYDPIFEEEGQDYPLAYVRWTEKRNFEAVLEQMANGRLDPRPLITHRFPIEEAPAAYDLLLSDKPSLGIALTYPDDRTEVAVQAAAIRLRDEAERIPGTGIAGLIGAGDFGRRTLIPAIRQPGFEICTVVSSGGLSAVFVLTRHDTHAALAARALKASKHVFVEKPLALNDAELENVRMALGESERILTVGFNRRFAPLAQRLKSLVDARTGPLSLVITVNAGRIDSSHWTQDPQQGGGRIVGEACHYFDLARFLVGASIRDVGVESATNRDGQRLDDVSHLTVSFDDGSTAAIHYLATGSRSYPKERVEAFFDGRTAAIDNWRRLRTWGLATSNSP